MQRPNLSHRRLIGATALACAAVLIPAAGFVRCAMSSADPGSSRRSQRSRSCESSRRIGAARPAGTASYHTGRLTEEKTFAICPDKEVTP